MSATGITTRIPKAELAEQWFSFLHGLIGSLQKTYISMSRDGTINQKIMGARLGKDAASVSRWMSGQQNMTVRTLHDLARAMDCRLEILVRPLNDVPKTNLPTQKPLAANTTDTMILHING
jgi:Helix-turn-helix